MNIDVNNRERPGENASAPETPLPANLTAVQRLYDLHARLADETDLSAALKAILAVACEFTGASRGCIQLVGEDGGRLETVVCLGCETGDLFTEHFRGQNSPAAGDLARRREPLTIEDVETFAPLRGTRDLEAARAAGVRAVQSAPVVSRGGKLVGVLSNQFTRPHRPTDDERRLLDLLALTVADFIARHHADAALRASERRQAFLLALSDALRPLADPAAVQGAACRLLGEHLGVDRAYYVTVDEAAGTTRVERDYLRGDSPSLVGQYRVADFGWIMPPMRRGELLVLPDVAASPLVPAADQGFMAAVQVAAHVNAPLIKNGVLVGALCVTERVPRAWSAAEAELVRETAERAWAAVERARAEEALAASEGKYRMLFDAVDEGFCVLELHFDAAGQAVDWTYTEANPAFEKQTGYRQPVGRRISHFQPDLERSWFERFAAVARTGEPTRFVQYTAAMGVWYDVYASRVGAPGDNRVSLLFTDVTAGKRQEANLAFLAEVSQDLVHLTSIDDALERLGAKIGAYFHVSRCAFCQVDEAGQTVTVTHEWKRADLPSLKGTYRLADYYSASSGAYATGEPFVVRDVDADARTNAAQMRALGIRALVRVPLVRDGACRLSLNVYAAAPRDWRADELELLRELTERIGVRLEGAHAEEALRESEEQFRSFVDATSDTVYKMSADWSEMRHLAGKQFLADTTDPSRTWLEKYIPAQEQGRVQAAIQAAIRDKRPFELEHRVLRADGTVGWTFLRAIALLDAQGEISEWIGAASDVTERKRAEQALRALLEERESLLKELHHRVKNNLQVVTSLLEMQARGVRDPGAVAALAESRHRIDSIATIHELLYQEGTFSQVELVAYTRELVARLVSFYQAQGRIEAAVAGENVLVDLDRAIPCGLLLNELISNVCKHAFPPPASGRLTVTLAQDDATLRLAVRDDGAGLPAGFDPRRSGTLGLQLVGLLAKQLGGAVAFRAEGGTEVEVRVPRGTAAP